MMDPKSKSRRELLKGGAVAVGTVAAGASVSKIAFAETPASGPAASLPSYAANEAPMVPASDDVIAYGVRSHYVTSKRIPVQGRPSPDDFGLEFHIATPLQDSFGTIQASSLHYVATTKGSFIPDIDPAKHTLMINGLVDRPRIFTMADLKRFPSVSRFHFIECSGNSANPRNNTVQESHGLTSNAEWTGVLLSTLLKECGLQPKATWFVAESAEEPMSSSPTA
jgi:sulfane dehydrogenase subunit SoxC